MRSPLEGCDYCLCLGVWGKILRLYVILLNVLTAIWPVWMTGMEIQKPPGKRGIYLDRMQILFFSPVCRCCCCMKAWKTLQSIHIIYFFHVNFQSLLFFIKCLTVESTLTLVFQVCSLRRNVIVLKKLCFACLFCWISSLVSRSVSRRQLIFREGFY